MAASVEPRQQFGRLERPVRGGGATNGAKAYPPPASHLPRRADSPVRGCGFPPLVSPPRGRPDDASDDEDDEQEDWRELYGPHLQLRWSPRCTTSATRAPPTPGWSATCP